jgi:GNAT superfamily N-acetyltransferase
MNAKEKVQNVTIRRGKAKDVKNIFALGSKVEELKFSKKSNFHEVDEILEWTKHPKEDIILVAEVDGKLAGFLYAKIINCHWCMLDDEAVKKEFRGKGIGTLLLNELYKTLKKQKIDYVQVLEEIHHKKTRKFWKEKGFKERKVFIWAEKTI